MDPDTFFVFAVISLGIALYNTSAWMRLDEKNYRKHYEKNTWLFHKIESELDYMKFKRREKKLFFYFVFLLIIVLIYYF